MADNAKEIHTQAREFYDRVAKFSSDLAKMGRGISTAVGAYNDAVSSYDARIIPSGKKLELLKVTEGAQRKVEEISQVDGAVKNVKHLIDKSGND
jgi:DNA recombination protein RmuC